MLTAVGLFKNNNLFMEITQYIYVTCKLNNYTYMVVHYLLYLFLVQLVQFVIIEVGNYVLVNIRKVDRGPLDTQNIICKVVEKITFIKLVHDLEL